MSKLKLLVLPVVLSGALFAGTLFGGGHTASAAAPTVVNDCSAAPACTLTVSLQVSRFVTAHLTISYADNDGSGTLSRGDSITDVVLGYN